MLVLDHSHADYFVCLFFLFSGRLYLDHVCFCFVSCYIEAIYRQCVCVLVVKFHMIYSPTNVNNL